MRALSCRLIALAILIASIPSPAKAIPLLSKSTLEDQKWTDDHSTQVLDLKKKPSKKKKRGTI
jgi:hypothetical protein